jgi:DNA-binding XRE family transcriptional regulator
MDFRELIERAKQKNQADIRRKTEPYYLKTIAWFQYLGLLRHNRIPAQRFTVTLKEALKAGELEPRILELIPAILIVLPKALKFKAGELPKDLAILVERIRKRQADEDFRGIPARNYLHWLRAPVLDIAKRRLDFHRIPRRRSTETHSIGEIIREGRQRLSLTQKELAKKYGLSLRVIRDLEQGKLDASLKATNEILRVFGRKISA